MPETAQGSERGRSQGSLVLTPVPGTPRAGTQEDAGDGKPGQPGQSGAEAAGERGTNTARAAHGGRGWEPGPQPEQPGKPGVWRGACRSDSARPSHGSRHK